MGTSAVPMDGRTFGHLTVVRRAGSNAYNHATWLCRCSCGGEAVFSGATLRRSEKKESKTATEISCGCRNKRKAAKVAAPLERTVPVPERWSVVERDGATHLLRTLGGREAIVDHDGTRWVCSECGPQKVATTAAEQCPHVVVVGRNLPLSLATTLGARVAKTDRKSPPSDVEKVRLKTQAEILAAGEAKRAERAREHDKAFVAATPVVVRTMTAEDRAKLEAARARRGRTFQEPERSMGFVG
jgi:hypothetical protein